MENGFFVTDDLFVLKRILKGVSISRDLPL